MLVVADSTPLHYLILIEEIDLLRKLYGRVTVPGAVMEELSASRTPQKVSDWIAKAPSWLSVAPAVEAMSLPFGQLGLGEREAIALAQRTVGSLLLTDDRQARLAAQSVGIRTVPTLRILSTAGELSLIDLEEALGRLQQTNFRVSRKLLDMVLQGRPLP